MDASDRVRLNEARGELAGWFERQRLVRKLNQGRRQRDKKINMLRRIYQMNVKFTLQTQGILSEVPGLPVAVLGNKVRLL